MSMAVCINGHSYDGLSPDNKEGCYVCIKAKRMHQSNMEICDLPASVKCGDDECESIRLTRVQAIGPCDEDLEQKVPELESGLVKQCEETAEGTLGVTVRCQRFYSHTGRHRSGTMGWDNMKDRCQAFKAINGVSYQCKLINTHKGQHTVDWAGTQAHWGYGGSEYVPEVSELVGQKVPMSITEWVTAAYENSKAHGFHEYILMMDYDSTMSCEFNALPNHHKNTNIAEKIALIHSEVSEALEDVRNGDMEESSIVTDNPVYDSKGIAIRKPVGFPSELADIVIRVLDLSGMLGIDLEGAMRRKHEYNKSRPHMHGKKF